MNLDDLSQFDSQLQLSLAAWGYYYDDYIRLSTGIKILQTSRGIRDQDYEIRLVHSLAERRLNEKWSIGEIHQHLTCRFSTENIYYLHFNYSFVHCPLVFSAGALIFGCTVALCFLIRDLMFYVIGESCVDFLNWA